MEAVYFNLVLTRDGHKLLHELKSMLNFDWFILPLLNLNFCQISKYRGGGAELGGHVEEHPWAETLMPLACTGSVLYMPELPEPIICPEIIFLGAPSYRLITWTQSSPREQSSGDPLQICSL